MIQHFFFYYLDYSIFIEGKDIMKTDDMNNMNKFLLIFAGLFFLSLSGCANFIKPEIGATAQKEARIELAKDGVKDASWNTDDLELIYSYSQSGDILNFAGTVTFDRSLTDSFEIIKSFFLKMSFLDSEGRVLKTVDISPLFRSYGKVRDELNINKSCGRPAGSTAIAFNYFGQFKAISSDGSSPTWEISYFPFD